MNWTSIGTTLGGLGFLLLGMGLLTDGLKRAAGQNLHRLLGRWTRTRTRALGAGTLITAVVQSSSAVTVAIIGFANAGLVTLPQAAWVVFGSNVGTTMTGWLVALVGLKIKVELLALPFLGLGMLVRLVRPHSRLRGVGEAIAGFGTLFVGLDLLKTSLSGLGHSFDVAALESWGIPGLIAGVGLGALMTTLMQSSSAAMAVILTARSQAVLSAPLAAALVIGANVGTTSTALLSTIGATPNARRVATLHVAFNLLTGTVALLLLDPILDGILWLHDVLASAPSPAADLALFHTTFNLLGLLIMWPLSGRLVRVLERRFRSAEEDASRPRHLDDNALPVPELAIRAALLELERAVSLGLALARDVVANRLDDPERYADRARPVRRLLVAIANYATRLNRADLPPGPANALTDLLRAHEHLWTMIRISGDLVSLRAESDETLPRDRLPISRAYLRQLLDMLEAADLSQPDFDVERCRSAWQTQEERRKLERQRLVELGTTDQASLTASHQALQELAHDRRLASRAWKLAAGLQLIKTNTGTPDGHTEDSEASPSARMEYAADPDGEA